MMIRQTNNEKEKTKRKHSDSLHSEMNRISKVILYESCKSLTENSFTQRSESEIREQHNEIEFFRMTF